MSVVLGLNMELEKGPTGLLPEALLKLTVAVFISSAFRQHQNVRGGSWVMTVSLKFRVFKKRIC